MWNYIFRTGVNLSRTIYAYGGRDGQNEDKVSAKDLEAAAISICQALKGKYKGLDGRTHAVNGDMTKVRYGTNLHPAAKRLLDNLEHTTSKLAGTQEVRKKMRHITHSFRVVYGQPIFITFSPNEKDSALMLRFSRSREHDPVHKVEASSRKFGGRKFPSLDTDFLRLSVEELRAQLPSYDERRTILARDPLAAADGFRVLCEVAMESLFGVHVCPRCPDCNVNGSIHPCQDSYGSSATHEGGIFGRVDALVGSIECQKAGSLHLHAHIFVQCLHQHTPMRELLQRIRDKPLGVVSGYLAYQAHVCKQTYEAPDGWEEGRRQDTETEWPEYKHTPLLLSRAQYLKSRAWQACTSVAALLADGAAWIADHAKRVQLIQEHRQHHVHLPDPKDPKQKRKPLTSCRRRDKPNECKSSYPQDKQLVDSAVVVCPELARKFGMPSKGKRNKVGSMHGPQNDPYLHGGHPAMHVALQCNNDVQVGYRLPISKETHSKCCDCEKECLLGVNDDDIAIAAQVAQDAQVGYTCDYQNKRNPIAVHEVKEWMKGHAVLTEQLKGESTAYIGRRHAQRLVSDLYGKGIVRGSVECTNLLTHCTRQDVTSAEMIKTARTATFPGSAYVRRIERECKVAATQEQRAFPQIDARNPAKKKIAIKDVDVLYGHRGTDPRVHFLSPYEFSRHCEIRLATYPISLAEADEVTYHTRLTERGRKKVEDCKNKA